MAGPIKAEFSLRGEHVDRLLAGVEEKGARIRRDSLVARIAALVASVAAAAAWWARLW